MPPLPSKPLTQSPTKVQSLQLPTHMEPQAFSYGLVEHDTIYGSLDQVWSADLNRPEQTTAVHRGGTVLKIKLG